MIHFVSMVYLDGALLALTDSGEVWQFRPIGSGPNGRKAGDPAWSKVADGPFHAEGL